MDHKQRTPPFKLQLSAEAQTNAQNTLGARAYRKWKATLPDTLASAARSWNLLPVKNLTGSTRGLVILCRQNGNDVVIKIPFDKEELAREFYALHIWEEAGATAMLQPINYDASLGTLLLPFAKGARCVGEQNTDVDPQEVADLIKALALPPPNGCRFASLSSDVHSRLDKNAGRLEAVGNVCHLNAAHIQGAHRIVDELSSSASYIELVHGDLYPGNVLVDDERLLACDPKGI